MCGTAITNIAQIVLITIYFYVFFITNFLINFEKMETDEVLQGRKERLNNVLLDLAFEKKARTQSDFAKILGVARSSVSKALNGDPGYLTEGFLKRVNRALPKYSLEWLMNGRDEINLLTNSDVMPKQDLRHFKVRLILAEQRDNYFKSYYTEKFLNTMPEFLFETNDDGKFLAFEVSVDNMEPEYYAGDIVVCEEVERDSWSTDIRFGDFDFIVCHGNMGVILCEIVSHDKESGDIDCRKLNGDNFMLNLKEVVYLYKIIEYRSSVKKRRRR